MKKRAEGARPGRCLVRRPVQLPTVPYCELEAMFQPGGGKRRTARRDVVETTLIMMIPLDYDIMGPQKEGFWREQKYGAIEQCGIEPIKYIGEVHEETERAVEPSNYFESLDIKMENIRRRAEEMERDFEKLDIPVSKSRDPGRIIVGHNEDYYDGASSPLVKNRASGSRGTERMGVSSSRRRRTSPSPGKVGTATEKQEVKEPDEKGGSAQAKVGTATEKQEVKKYDEKRGSAQAKVDGARKMMAGFETSPVRNSRKGQTTTNPRSDAGRTVDWTKVRQLLDQEK